jgi:hypothetical protein
MITREPVPAQPDKVRITFSLPASLWADNVQLAGDFDGQSSASRPLHRDESGWSITLLLERDRAYTYCYLVDQETLTDWNADGYITSNDGQRQAIVVAHAE